MQTTLIIHLTGAARLVGSVTGHADGIGAPFGDEADSACAEKIWHRLSRQTLVGEGAITAVPYTGMHPHGAIFDTLDARTRVGSDEGP